MIRLNGHPDNGAHHRYVLRRRQSSAEAVGNQPSSDCVGFVQFQRGPRNVAGSTPGTLDGAVLSILIHRRECFQAGPYGCEENAKALEHLLAVRQLDFVRVKDRVARGVLGKNEK